MSKHILESLADGVLLLDADSNIRYANAAMCKLLLTTTADLVGQPFKSILSETELLALLGIGDAVTPDAPTWLQVVFKRGNGDYIPLSLTLSAHVDATDTHVGYVAVCRTQDEIREMLVESSRMVAAEVERRVELQRDKDAAERREQLQIEASQASKLESIGQLAAGIAHEINTPIQFIGDNVVFLERAFKMLFPLVEHAKRLRTCSPEEQGAILKDLRTALRKAKADYLAQEVPSALTQTQEGVARVAKIVRAMKEVSHPSSGDVQHLDLNRAIESTITVARNEWKYVATVETDLHPELPPVPCYCDEINQVFLNIMVNAAHAIAEARADACAELGKITIKTRHSDTHAEIRIGDTGTGIPDHVLERIFDPFFTTKEVGKGTGQGLALSYNVVVHRHNGQIDVETKPGEGTTFVVRLPLQHTPRTSAPTDPTVEREQRLRGGVASNG